MQRRNRSPQRKDFARTLRRRMTPSEKKLWALLRGRRFAGFKFRRQHPLGRYTVDFYCADAALVLELDGESHVGREHNDRARQRWLEGQGLKILRCWDTEVFENLNGLQELIWHECQTRRTAQSVVNP